MAKLRAQRSKVGRPQYDLGRGREIPVFGVPESFILAALISEFSGVPILRPTAGTASQVTNTSTMVHKSYSLKLATVPYI